MTTRETYGEVTLCEDRVGDIDPASELYGQWVETVRQRGGCFECGAVVVPAGKTMTTGQVEDESNPLGWPGWGRDDDGVRPEDVADWVFCYCEVGGQTHGQAMWCPACRTKDSTDATS